MVIHYKDGSKLTCSEIELSADYVYADKLYPVNINEIDYISDE